MGFLTAPEFATWWQEFWYDADPSLRDSAHPSRAHLTGAELTSAELTSAELTGPTGGFSQTTVQRPDGARASVGGWLLPGAGFGTPPQRIGIIVARQGAFSLGLVENGSLVAHHTGRRYVQGRTAAGGWSQQRYARRRENQRSGQIEVLTAKIPHIITEPHALVWAGDRRMYTEIADELYQGRQYAHWQELPQREFPDVGKPSFAILKQVAWRSTRILVRDL